MANAIDPELQMEIDWCRNVFSDPNASAADKLEANRKWPALVRGLHFQAKEIGKVKINVSAALWSYCKGNGMKRAEREEFLVVL